MKEITVTTQAEIDALPDSFAEYTRIYIKAQTSLVVGKSRENSSVVAWGNSSVVDEFRNNPGDRYVAVEIHKKDLFAWPGPQYPHKIGFRKGTALYECDRFGKKIEAE